MPERDTYAHRFTGNPLDRDPLEAYRTLQWGKAHENTWEHDGPEDLVCLGSLAALELEDGREAKWSERRAPFLAVGVSSNDLYAVPKRRNGEPVSVPDGPYHYVGQVGRTDYYSDKGNEPGYYYHEHQNPYPALYESDGGVLLWRPARHRGRRSYVVAKEGIIG